MKDYTFPPGVYIIGAGPGDPELLTVKAYKILQKADVIVYADSLVPREILQDANPEAEVIGTADKTLEQILPLMIQKVRANCVVARLHSGDLSLYSAIHEQIQVLIAAQIPFELIPGIGVFQAAAARLSVELTVPSLVQTIILTRISGRASEVPPAEELSSLAAHKASLCLYLAARHIEAAQEKLLQHYSADTPVAVCFRVGWPDEKILIVPLEKIALTTQENNLTRTTLYIISAALGELDPQLIEARSSLYHLDHSHLFRESRL